MMLPTTTVKIVAGVQNIGYAVLVLSDVVVVVWCEKPRSEKHLFQYLLTDARAPLPTTLPLVATWNWREDASL
jgi:hypothetical protein